MTDVDTDEDILGIPQDELSNQAKNFLESPLGAYLVERIAQDIELARDELEELDPWADTGRAEWERAQFNLGVARNVNRYFGELLLSEVETLDTEN